MLLEEAFEGAPVLVTGGYGFIGSNLVRRLVRLGARVTVVDALVPNTGANRLLYIAPLMAIVAGAALVVTLLRRFRQRDQEKTAHAGADAPVTNSKRDDYDDKLDEELKQLDDA